MTVGTAKVISVFLILLVMMIAEASRAWDIDWSRRQSKPSATGSPDSALPQNQQQQQDVALPAEESQNAAQVAPLTVVGADGSDGSSTPTTTSARPKAWEGLVQTNHTPYAGDRQEFVILNTAHGFIPSNVRIHKGLHYIVHIVNVNEDKKNVSFMLDAFNQHYATYFGQIKSFNLDPDKEGIFDFQCPETNSAGKLIVFGQGAQPARNISSQGK